MSILIRHVHTFSEEPAYTPHSTFVTQPEIRLETAKPEADTSLLRNAVI